MKVIESPLTQGAEAKKDELTVLQINRCPNWVAREFRSFAVKYGMSSAKALELCVRILQEKDKKFSNYGK